MRGLFDRVGPPQLRGGLLFSEKIAMATVEELLKANGIELKSAAAPGRHYTPCPQCSHTRKASHRNKPCLGITIDAKGATWGCNHCGWTGPEKGNGSDAGGQWIQ